MINFIVKIIFLHLSISSENSDHVENQIIDKIIAAFDDDDKNLNNWMKYNIRRQFKCLILIKKVKQNVNNILSVINTEEYADVKSLIMKTDIDFYKLGTTYYGMFNVLESIKYILKMNDEQNSSKSKTYNMLNFVEEILYKVYDKIYENLDLTVKGAGFYFNLKEMLSVDSIKTKVSKVNGKNFSITVNFFNFLNKLIDSILPVDYKNSVYVTTDLQKFSRSRKSYGSAMNCLIKGKYSLICRRNNKFRLTLCVKNQTFLPLQVEIKDYMCKAFLCNKETAHILILLFHYYSEISNNDLNYKISLKEDNNYKIVLNCYSKIKNNRSKLFWLNKKITDLEKRKRIHKFSLLVKYDKAYSTIKTDDTKDIKIFTRLILLDCGHQLGFDLIDEVFEHYYDNKTKMCLCTVCRIQVPIVGAYDAEVYKYK